jgi:lysozyme
MRAVTDRAKAIARQFEGFRDVAYLCPAQVWTIGYGHTLAVRPGQVCTKRQADLWLDADFRAAALALERKIGEANVLDLTDNQHDALCDFIFNLGVGDHTKPEWRIWGLLRSRSYDQIPAQLARFVYAGKTKLSGLVKRRNAEIELWSDGEPGSADEPTSSAETRITETPPAPAPKEGMWAHVLTMGTAAVAGVGSAVKSVTDTVGPFADKSPIIGHLVPILATVGACAAVIALALAWAKARRSHT